MRHYLEGLSRNFCLGTLLCNLKESAHLSLLAAVFGNYD
jgi:hypothetical protein